MWYIGRAARRRSSARRRRSSSVVRSTTEATASATLGTLLKYREDQQRVQAHGIQALLEAASGRGR